MASNDQIMYPGGSKDFDERTGKYRLGTGPGRRAGINPPKPKRPGINPPINDSIRPKPPILRMEPIGLKPPVLRVDAGITGPGGKSVDRIYNTY